MKNPIIKLTVALTVAGGVALAVPGVASAHSNHIRVVVKAGCATGVNLEAHDYPVGQDAASVTVEYDGEVTYQQLFGPSIKATAPNPDMSVAHVGRVTFDRFNYVGPDGDKVYTFTTEACVPPPVPSQSDVTTTPVATDEPPVPTTLPCQEDEPCFDCTTMGNLGCVTTTVQLPPPAFPNVPPSGGLPVTGDPTLQKIGWGMVIVGCGWGLIRLARRPRRT